MSIDNISNNKQISRAFFESEENFQDEKVRNEILSIFDELDEQDNDNQKGVLTNELRISDFFHEIYIKFREGFMKIFEKIGLENIKAVEDDDYDSRSIRELPNINEVKWFDAIHLMTFYNIIQRFLMNKIAEKLDNGDSKVQKNEAKLFMCLLNIANSLVENPSGKLDGNHVSLKGMEMLLQKIEDGSIDINKMKEDFQNGNTISYEYPQAEDITENLSIKQNSYYNVKVFKTNTTKNYDGVGDGKSSLEYNTFVISFIDKETNIAQNLKVHLDKLFDEKDIKEILKQMAEGNSKRFTDLITSEINDLYITSPKNNTRKFGSKKDSGSNLSQSTKAGGFYRKQDESINIYGKNIAWPVMYHELGHAKDRDENLKKELYELIKKDNVKLSEYLLWNKNEMYAEFFTDFVTTQSGVYSELMEKYGDTISQLPDDVKQKFIEEATVSILTSQDTKISSILDRAGLNEYNGLFDKIINKKLKLPNYSSAYNHIKAMKKFGKENPKVTELYIKLMHEIAYDYNNPKARVEKDDLSIMPILHN